MASQIMADFLPFNTSYVYISQQKNDQIISLVNYLRSLARDVVLSHHSDISDKQIVLEIGRSAKP